MFALLGFPSGVRDGRGEMRRGMPLVRRPTQGTAFQKVREIVDPGISRVLARVFQR